jgi:hypothetical protein
LWPAFTVDSFTMQMLREGRAEIFDNLLCRVKKAESSLTFSTPKPGLGMVVMSSA